MVIIAFLVIVFLVLPVCSLQAASILNRLPGLKPAIAFICSFAINLASFLPGLVLL